MAVPETKIQQKIAGRKQRWIDCYDPKQLPSSLFLIRFMPELAERPWPRPQEKRARIEWAWRKVQLQRERMEWLEDDTLPFLDVYTGTEIFAAAFGCPVYYPENDMPFVMPRIRAAEEVAGIEVPGLDVHPVNLLFEIAEELHSRAGGSALFHMVDLQSPMDIAALIWDKTQFYPALIEHPEAVRELADKVKTFMVRFLDEWFGRFGREFIAHHPDYYMPAGISLSVEEIGAVSSKMYRSLFLPELADLADHYGGLGLHCGVHARHQWENIRQMPGLRFVSLVEPSEANQEAVNFFSETAAQWYSYAGEGLAWTLPAQHPTQARMVYEIAVSSKAEALETSARMRDALRR